MPKLSVLIPAYGNSDSLSRALETLAEQTISKEISVLISDDNSPKPIDRERILTFEGSFHDLTLVRQTSNLGVLSNKEWLYRQVQTDFFTFLEHDDWLIRNDFYERALEALKIDLKTACFYGNCIAESGWDLADNGVPFSKLFHLYNDSCETPIPKEDLILNKLMKYAYVLADNKLTKKLIGINSNLSLGGKEFIENLVNSSSESPFVTSWSALVFKTSLVRKVGGFGGAYTITWAEAKALNVYREEEHFGLLYLLATCYRFQLEEEPSIVRGFDPLSFSRNVKEHPAKDLKQDSAFYATYKYAWFIYKGFTGKIDKDIIRLLYARCAYIGLVAPTNATNSFLKSYLPEKGEIEEMAKNSLSEAIRA